MSKTTWCFHESGLSSGSREAPSACCGPDWWFSLRCTKGSLRGFYIAAPFALRCFPSLEAGYPKISHHLHWLKLKIPDVRVRLSYLIVISSITVRGRHWSSYCSSRVSHQNASPAASRAAPAHSLPARTALLKLPMLPSSLLFLPASVLVLLLLLLTISCKVLSCRNRVLYQSLSV